MSQIGSKRDNIDIKTLPNILKSVKNDQNMMSNLYNQSLLPSRELVFLQSQSNFIEKTLGAGEQIKLRFECLAAHSPTVSIIKNVGNDFELNLRGHLRIFS